MSRSPRVASIKVTPMFVIGMVIPFALVAAVWGLNARADAIEAEKKRAETASERVVGAKQAAARPNLALVQ